MEPVQPLRARLMTDRSRISAPSRSAHASAIKNQVNIPVSQKTVWIMMDYGAAGELSMTGLVPFRPNRTSAWPGALRRAAQASCRDDQSRDRRLGSQGLGCGRAGRPQRLRRMPTRIAMPTGSAGSSGGNERCGRRSHDQGRTDRRPPIRRQLIKSDGQNGNAGLGARFRAGGAAVGNRFGFPKK